MNLPMIDSASIRTERTQFAPAFYSLPGIARASQFFALLSVCFLLLFSLSACAGFDASVLDSAKCMGKGHLSTGVLYGMGIDVPEWLQIDPEDIFDSDSAGPLQSLELKYGVQDDLDATVRFSVHGDGSAAKLLFKKQLSQEDRISTAVVVGGGFLSAGDNYWNNSSSDFDDTQFRLLSAEVQLLATKDFSRNMFVTLAARGNYHSFEQEHNGYTSTREQFYHGGARINVGRSYKGFSMIFELGVEVPLSAGQIEQVYPWGGYKLAWDWNSKKI